MTDYLLRKVSAGADFASAGDLAVLDAVDEIRALLARLVSLQEAADEYAISFAIDEARRRVREAETRVLPPAWKRAGIRSRARLEQRDLAELLGVSQSTIANWENGRTQPSPPNDRRYARLLAGLAAEFPDGR